MGDGNKVKSYITKKQPMPKCKGWFRCEVAMLMTNVLCFVGNRKEMLDTLFEAPVMKGLPKEHIVEIGGEIAEVFDKRCNSVAGEVIPYGDIQFIRLSEFSGAVYDVCVLAHECLHAAEWMLRNMGIKEQENRTSELLAYTQEYIFKTLMMALYRANGYDLSGDKDKIG